MSAVEEEEIEVPAGAENPDAVRNAIKAERAAARKANARARELEAELRAREDAEVPLEDKARQAEEAAAAAELRALRIEVAAKAGLDLQLASRLQGSNEEELLADAEALKGLTVSAPAQPAVPPEGGLRQPAPTPTDPIKAHNALMGAILGGAQQARGSRDPLAGLEPAPEDA